MGADTSKISSYFPGFILDDWLTAIYQRLCRDQLSWKGPPIELGLGNTCQCDTRYVEHTSRSSPILQF